MADYGGIQRGPARLEIDPETGEQRVVYDDIDVSPDNTHQNAITAFMKTSSQIMDPRKSALPYVLPAAMAVSGATGAGAAASQAAQQSVTPAGGGGSMGFWGNVGKVAGNVLGGGGSGGGLGKWGTAAKILGGMVDQSASNRGQDREYDLDAYQLDQQAARDREAAGMNRVKSEVELKNEADRRRAIAYQTVMQAERALNWTPEVRDVSGYKHDVKLRKSTGGKFTPMSEAERQAITQIRDNALREAMNPDAMPSLPEYMPAAAPTRGKSSGWLEKIGGPASMALGLWGNRQIKPSDVTVDTPDTDW